jgi:hypothetical protein
MEEWLAMYFILIEIDTFEVVGKTLGTAELVRKAIEDTLSDKGRLAVRDEFEAVMRSMSADLEAKRRWDYNDADGVRVRVARYE